ncbi:hypothetical protein ACQZV8_12860 [Magnetococcales bacterium HHB-1]
MGLDGVELLLYCERKFNVDIYDHAAKKVATVGDLCDCIEASLGDDLRSVWNSEMIFADVRAYLVDLIGVKEEKVRRESHLIHDLGLD